MDDILDSSDEQEFQDIINSNMYHPTTRKELEDIISDLLRRNVKNLNCIDVSKITNFSKLFYKKDMTDIDISCWNVSNGQYFDKMFMESSNVTSDFSGWSLDSVESAS